MEVHVPFLFVILLSAVQFLSDRLTVERSRYSDVVTSFASAIAITYLLFNLLPEAYSNSSGALLFVPLIVGFTFIHLLEKFYYEEFEQRFHLKRVRSFHDELHAAVLFIYHLAIGAVLFDLVIRDLTSALLLMPPLMLFTTIGNWSLHHTYVRQRAWLRLLLASGTIIGGIVALGLIELTLHAAIIQTIIFNFAVGILLFIVIQEALPTRKKGEPLAFVAGITVYTMLLILLQNVA